MRTALGLSLLVLGVSFTVGCGEDNPPPPAPELSPDWQRIQNEEQEQTLNASVVKLDSGLVLVAGGRPKVPESEWDEETKKKLVSSALYDPVKKEWKQTGDIAQPRQQASAVTLSSGKVLLSGGKSLPSRFPTKLVESVELYDPVAGTWKTIGDWEQPRYGHQSTLLPSGKVLVTGGFTRPQESSTNTKGRAATTAELYDPATNQWSSAEGLEPLTTDASLTLLESGEVMVLSLGGVGIYNPEANTWSQQENAFRFVAPLGHAATRLDSGEILVTGGTNGYNLNSTALYKPTEKTWVAGPPLNQGHWNHKVIPLTGGKALVIGGFGGVELYDPTNTQKPWTQLAEDPGTYNKGNAILLSDKQVLLWGGVDKDTPWSIFTIPE